MSARERLHAAVLAHLGENASLDPLRVFDAPQERAAVPFAVIEEPVLGDWSACGWDGREGRLVIAVFDEGEQPRRLRFLMGRLEDAMERLPDDIGEGWRIVQSRLIRSRGVRAGGRRWGGAVEFQVRMFRMDS